jgi:hypothetical protein
MKTGRPSCNIALAWKMRFGLSDKQRSMCLGPSGCWQLCRCRSDEARRLILGISR